MQRLANARKTAAVIAFALAASSASAASDDDRKSRKTIEAPPDKATETSEPAIAAGAANLRQMFTRGDFDGNLRMLYFANHNAFFNSRADRNTASVGGKLGFETAALRGFSLRLSAYAQQNFARDGRRTGRNRDLGDDIATLGEAYVQWAGYDFQLRAGNQLLTAPPFTSTYDYRIIPQVYQGVKARYGDAKHYVTAMRMFRFKSRINDAYERKTNYNASFSPFGPNTTRNTDGFWALGAANGVAAGRAHLSGQAWFLNYIDYANLFYTDATLARAEGGLRPFASIQFIRENEAGDAYLGEVDSHVYGAQLGVKRKSLTATLNYDYIGHEAGAFLNGSLATPYASGESSGPLFAQPFLTSTQDLGSGNAYAAEIKGAPTDNTFAGARYSYMDLKPAAGSRAIGQSEYLVYGIYHFQGALEGLSLLDFFAYQTQDTASVDYWENRLKLQYAF